MRILILAAALLADLSTTALADPVGSYDVRGTNPDGAEGYKGTVKVTRNRETYKVVWHIGDQPMTGVGIGMKMVGGRMQAGPASKDDVGLSVAYRLDDAFGTVLYLEQEDGSWRGIWAYDGWKQVATEDWLLPKSDPRRKIGEKADVVPADRKSIDQPQALTSPIPVQPAPAN